MEKIKNIELSDRGDTLAIEINYPRNNEIQKVLIGLCDVRAADSILIEFDFERNGWLIRQDKTEDKDQFMDVIEEKVEVAFIPAWNELTPSQEGDIT